VHETRVDTIGLRCAWGVKGGLSDGVVQGIAVLPRLLAKCHIG
jgi:hypothetical protein